MDDKRLDTRRVERAMEERGLSAAGVAEALGVSRTIVSEWLKGRKLPRPGSLLAIGKLLGLSYAELVAGTAAAEPMVAFRKHGNAKQRPEDEDRARAMGRAVELLLPYLPFRRLNSPVRLIGPKNDAAYIEEAAAETRAAMGVRGQEIRFEDLIGLFTELKAVLIPVLWGAKDSLDNGLHVYLPESQTTLVYMNLDVRLFDFKFWMLHELAHAKTTTLLDGAEAERFADAFAAAVLVPRELAAAEASRLAATADLGRRITRVIDLAQELVVSPITVATRVDAAARAAGGAELVGRAVFPAAANFYKKFGLVSEELFGPGIPEAKDFIAGAEKIFGSPIYPALRAYLAERGPSEGIVAASLGIPPADAKAVLDALRVR